MRTVRTKKTVMSRADIFFALGDPEGKLTEKEREEIIESLRNFSVTKIRKLEVYTGKKEC
tara:strand:+ start:2056 stop:2235 length:180 start_codon:yes stop_codon:yes gene_type:complete